MTSVTKREDMKVNPWHLPLGEQEKFLRQVLSTNKTLMTVLNRASQLNIPNWYLAAGSISQTIWNYMSGKDAETGISDYDLVYHDASDISYEAEDAVIQAAKVLYADISADVEVRNQARVHLWYGKKHGKECPVHGSVEAGIDSWISTSAMIGIRTRDTGKAIDNEDEDEYQEREWDIYAPRGLSEHFRMVVRPNAELGTREAFEKKAARWKTIWDVKVEGWPSSA